MDARLSSNMATTHCAIVSVLPPILEYEFHDGRDILPDT